LICCVFVHSFVVYVISMCFGIGTKAHLGGSEARFCTKLNLCKNGVDITSLFFLFVYVTSTCFGIGAKLIPRGQWQGFVPIRIRVDICVPRK
jgi:hypothetical protein